MINTQTDSGHKPEINNSTPMKNLKITPPEGYEIDKEKSTFEEIVFKPVKKQLPKSWEELEEIKGHWIDGDCEIYETEDLIKCTDDSKNIFATEKQAKASIALAQLSQLRELYRDGWEPDWEEHSCKYVIIAYKNKLKRDAFNYSTNAFLSFQTEEIRDEFLANFKDLIEEASPLLFG